MRSVPQSVTMTFSFGDIALAGSESTTVPRVSVNTPLTVPVFWMSTVPLVAGSPGFMPAAVRMAEADFELPMVSVPAVNVLAGLPTWP